MKTQDLKDILATFQDFKVGVNGYQSGSTFMFMNSKTDQNIGLSVTFSSAGLSVEKFQKEPYRTREIIGLGEKLTQKQKVLIDDTLSTLRGLAI